MTPIARLITPAILAATGIAVPAPVNDNFSAAIELVGDSGRVSGHNNIDATLEAGEPTCYYSETDNSVWFKWVCSETGTFSLSTTGSSNGASEWDAVVCIYTGPTLLTLSQVGEQDVSFDESLSLSVSAGTTYYIQLGGDPSPAIAGRCDPRAFLARPVLPRGARDPVPAPQVNLRQTRNPTCRSPDRVTRHLPFAVVFRCAGRNRRPTP